MVKNLPPNALDGKKHGFDPWVRKSPWKRKRQPTPVYLLGKSHSQRNLAGYSSWGGKESDTIEYTYTGTEPWSWHESAKS